ncbi:hypothetical protein ACH4PW_27665 [Streptomyces sp. NPDC017082]|uniref:hypothetical protein n=1 Tax=Streptomyces sp. NPDC017082 TaxID=3364974 RepID=UPI0037A15A5D
MDPLVTAAATALVSSMATDAWQQVRATAVALWQRALPESSTAVDAELAQVREEIVAARDGDDQQAEADLAQEWGLRLARLLRQAPELTEELGRLLDDEWLPLLGAADRERAADIRMTAHASGQARIYQAGRDQHIT